MLSPGIFMIAAVLLSGNVLMGFVTSRLAMRKGYLIGGFLFGKYFVTGLLLGIVGLIYVGFLPEEEEQFESKIKRAIIDALAYTEADNNDESWEAREDMSRGYQETKNGYYVDEDASEPRGRRARARME